MVKPEIIQRILDTAQIDEVIQDFVSLKKRGTNLMGLCPFHNEKTPSFVVSPAKGIFRCFGCGKAGNSVKFVMEHEAISYVEALRYLAGKYQIPFETREATPEEQQEQHERDSMLIVNQFAASYFSQYLTTEDRGIAVGMSYFKERGFRFDIIHKFQLGFCPEGFDEFSQHALKTGYKKEYLVKTGLTIEKDNRFYDRFSGRVMFPIHSLSGKVIAFGGRTLRTDKNTAKYLNSPESEVYHKSQTLYGIFFARQAIMKHDKCFLVEGYTDVLSMHQAGIENVAASSGTALTREQIRLIRRFTPNITILYDGDAAGIKASLRGIDLVVAEGMNVRVVLLPEGHDPDSFCRQHTASEALDYIAANETDFIGFKTRLLIDEADKDPMRRSALISDILQTIALIPDEVLRAVYIKECSRLLSMEEGVIYSQINRILKKRSDDSGRRTAPEIRTSPLTSEPELQTGNQSCHPIERELLRVLINYGNDPLYTHYDNSATGLCLNEDEVMPVATYIIEAIEKEKDDLTFDNPVYRAFYDTLCSYFVENRTVDDKMLSLHPDETISTLAAELLSRPYQLSKIWNKWDNIISTREIELKESVPKLILDYKSRKVRLLIESLSNRLKERLSEAEETEILTRLVGLRQLQSILAKELGNRVII